MGPRLLSFYVHFRLFTIQVLRVRIGGSDLWHGGWVCLEKDDE